MYKEGQSISDVSENDFAAKGKFGSKIVDSNATGIQSSEHTGSDSVKIRYHRAAVVCLVLLCVLLLTAVIVLCVIFIQESQQFISKTENVTNDRELLMLKNTDLTNERDQLTIKNTDLTNKRDQLTIKNTDLTNERDQLTIKNKNLTNERDQLILKNTDLTNKRDQLMIKNINLTNDRDQLTIKNTDLTNERDQLREFLIAVWKYYKSSFYYLSTEMQNWTESRRYCTERGADLIIINNREEHDFVKNMSVAAVYIGLTDIDEEGRWKWVDGSTLTPGFSFWASGGNFNQPSGGAEENCAMTVAVPQPEFANLVGWHDVACNRTFHWICEKRISQFTLP